MPRVVVPDDAPPVLGGSQAYQQLLARAEVEYYDTLPGAEDRLIERLGSAGIALNIRSSSAFTENVFRSCPKLRMLSLWGTGTDNVDLAAAARHGVRVTNTPGVGAIAVAEHTLALLLATARRIPQLDAETRRGAWPRGQVTQMHGKTMGVIGLGAIGRRFAALARGIGMRVIAWTMHPDPSLGFDLVSLDELLRASDAVSLHLRLSEETRSFIGRRELALLKPSAILINTARGAIMDEDALVEAIEGGRLAGAGLDVFGREPLAAHHPLMRLSNVVLTPHSAGVTAEALEAGLQLAVDNIWSFLEGRPANVVV